MTPAVFRDCSAPEMKQFCVEKAADERCGGAELGTERVWDELLVEKKSLCLTGTAANRLHSAHRDTVSHEYKYQSESHSILGVQYDLTSVLWIIYSINMLNNVCW